MTDFIKSAKAKLRDKRKEIHTGKNIDSPVVKTQSELQNEVYVVL